MTISRQRFNKWLVAYAYFKYECEPLTGRDKIGKWIEFVHKSHYDTQGNLDL